MKRDIDISHGDIVIIQDLKIDVESIIRQQYKDQVDAVSPNGAIMRNLEGGIDLVCAWWRMDGVRMTWVHSGNIKEIKKWNEKYRVKHVHDYFKSQDQQLRICLECKQIQTREAYKNNDQQCESWITRKLTPKPKKIKMSEVENDIIIFDDVSFLESLGMAEDKPRAKYH